MASWGLLLLASALLGSPGKDSPSVWIPTAPRPSSAFLAIITEAFPSEPGPAQPVSDLADGRDSPWEGVTLLFLAQIWPFLV